MARGELGYIQEGDEVYILLDQPAARYGEPACDTDPGGRGGCLPAPGLGLVAVVDSNRSRNRLNAPLLEGGTLAGGCRNRESLTFDDAR